MVRRFPPLSGVLVLIAAILLQPVVAAAQNYSFIRDAEIEHTIRTYATPLFQAAGLQPSAIDVYIVNDKTLNAFVAGGQKLFINTGLLMASDDPNQVIGVIAHETGHILGGHLARTHDQIKNSTAQAILAMVLGAAVAVGTGRPDVGQAVIQGGQQIGQRSFLAYSRTQESAADQAAARLLDATGQSSRGLLGLMETLEDQELLSAKYQDPYVRTHPLTSERMSFLRNHLGKSKFSDAEEPADIKAMHLRMVAKLYAFINPPEWTFREYPQSDTSIPARYARAVAYYRIPDLDKALPLIDGLIAERPQDPYFHELKGQMLFENGRGREAIAAYTEAVRRLPQSPLLRVSLGQAQIETGEETLLQPAIDNLRIAVARERTNSFAWRQLAIAYGRLGNTGMSSLALAEEALLKRDNKAAIYQAERAARELPEGSPDWLKARDILQTAGKPEDREQDRPQQ